MRHIMRSLVVLLVAALGVCALAQEQPANAALIVGGYWYFTEGNPVQDKAELFCNGVSVELPNFPIATYLADGVLYQDGERVMVCGGYSCNTNNVCAVTKDCYWFKPNGAWDASAPDLLEARFNYLMASAIHIDFSGQGVLPLSLGYGYETEIFNKRDNKWEPYRQLEDRNWYSMGCLINYNDRIYSMRDKIIELDPNTWTFSDIHTLPDDLVRSGKCSGLTLGDHPGIFSRYGYWYDLTAKNWTKKAAPPVEPITGSTNVMWTHNGKPTIFGNPLCDDLGNCDNKLIVQYDPNTNTWKEIGQMIQPRIYQTVIEVPFSWCESYGVTSATTSTTTTTTTSGSASMSFGALTSGIMLMLAKLM